MTKAKILSATIGVILAGGKATRLGGALKANLILGGASLLWRVHQAIEQDCQPIILSIGEHGAEQFNDGASLISLADAGLGPAVALIGAARHAIDRLPKAAFLLSVAVDTPFFPADFVQTALRKMEPETDVVVGAFASDIYPTNALWRLSALSKASQAVADVSAPALFALLDRCQWRKLDYGETQNENPFFNINNPDDLRSCERRDALQNAGPKRYN